MRLSGAIMAHEKRRLWAEALSEQTGFPIVWDRVQSVWETATRAWRAHDRDAAYHVVVQDDAVLCRDFVPSVSRFLDALEPGTPAVLTVVDYRLHGSRADYENAVASGRRIWRSWQSVSAVAVALPVADIEPMLAYGDRFPNVTHDDWKMRAYYRNRRVKFAFPIPSLAQHRHASENPSLLPGHDAKFNDRTSGNFVGEDVSALDIEWTNPQEGDVQRATYRNRKTGSTVAVPVGSKAAAHFERQARWVLVDVTGDAEQADEAVPVPPAVLTPPPRTGPGSSRAAWLAYAHLVGVPNADGMTRTELVEACDADPHHP